MKSNAAKKFSTTSTTNTKETTMKKNAAAIAPVVVTTKKPAKAKKPEALCGSCNGDGHTTDKCPKALQAGAAVLAKATKKSGIKVDLKALNAAVKGAAEDAAAKMRAPKAPKAPKAEKPLPVFAHDERVPAVGTEITKVYRPRGGEARTLSVVVERDGFTFEGQHFQSLHQVGNAARGKQATDGFWFFGLYNPKEGAAKKQAEKAAKKAAKKAEKAAK